MKVLVVGSGGREHTLIWKIRRSPLVSEVWCAPGNGGIASDAECVNIDASDVAGLADFAEEKKADLTVVGPELTLTLGIVDEFQRRGMTVFGASQAASQLEGSKVFAKEFMARHGIPTAGFQVCTKSAEAEEVVKSGRFGYPLVLKADGLAAGKGVLIAHDEKQALEAIRTLMVGRAFGKAGDLVVVEEFLEGEEMSFMVISDGEHVVPLVTSQDHKAIFDGDQGPNTGGMGAYSPAITAMEDPEPVVMNSVILPTVQGMRDEGLECRGVVYAGLMITEQGPKVLEFNIRFGDPETQVILPRMADDLVPLLLGSARGRLETDRVGWRSEPAVCVVLASDGYPAQYEKGKTVSGVESFPWGDDAQLFHAGTTVKEKTLVTSGGRVFGVTALASDLEMTIRRAYELADGITFDGCYRRSDIGAKALKRLLGGSAA